MNQSLVYPPPAGPPSPARLPPPQQTAPDHSTRSTLIAGIVALALIAGSAVLDIGAWALVPIVFVLVVPFEKLFPRHPGQRIRRPGWRTDIGWALAAPALGVITISIAIAVSLVTFAWLPGLLLRPLVALIPGVALPFVGIVLFDMTSYWVHRWAHEVPLLWRFHSVHHSPSTMDWVSGFRNHPAEGAILAPPFVLLSTAGFDATFTGALLVIQIFLGLFLHANVRWRLRPLHRIFVTPEFHHWHHANEQAAHHTNYSIFLPIWDTVFGTYRMPTDRRPTVYGIDEVMAPTIAGQLWWPFRHIERPVRTLLSGLIHPLRSARAACRMARAIVTGIWASTRRPTRRSASQPVG